MFFYIIYRDNSYLHYSVKEMIKRVKLKLS